MLTFQQIGYMGRLGNQMFQFASTLGISDRLGFEPRFPIENCLNYQESGPFDPKIGRCMPVKCDLTDCFNISPEYFIPQRHINQERFYHENKFGYNSETEFLSDNTSLSGYFQTDKYFSEFRDLILSQLIFKNTYRDSAESYIQTIRENNKNAVIASIHVRRGDYVMFPDHHPLCSSNYYNNAIRELRILNDNIKCVIFSDDVEWCKTEFTDPDCIISNLENPYTEMCAMTLCDNNIIANSSFSWWGAWLNKNPNKIVISPSRWFGSAMNKDTSDVYCKDWIII
jgi:hypothetical protein